MRKDDSSNEVDYDHLSKGSYATSCIKCKMTTTVGYTIAGMVVKAIIKSCGLKSNRGGWIAEGDESPSLLLLYPSSSEDTLPSTSKKFNMSSCQLQLSSPLHGPP